jgi:hypothetical protein
MPPAESQATARCCPEVRAFEVFNQTEESIRSGRMLVVVKADGIDEFD